MRLLNHLLVFSALCCFGSAFAVEVKGLYEAEVPVPDKEQATRKVGLGTALLGVLVKVSGKRSPDLDPQVNAAVRNPSRYVQQFRYDSSFEQDKSGQPVQKLSLWARFDPGEVDSLLRSTGLPVWGRTRPAVLVWLGVEMDAARELVGAEDVSGLAETLYQSADQRGIPLLLPLLDLEDRARLSTSDVWAGFDDSILAASRRYQSETVLVGRVYQVLPTVWEARWRLFLDQAPYDFTSQGDSVALALEEGLGEVADLIARRFARVGAVGDQSLVSLVVSDVNTLPDYARTLRYLESLDGVSSVNPTEVIAGSVSFRLESRGGADALQQVISLGRTLSLVDASDPLRYRLLR